MKAFFIFCVIILSTMSKTQLQKKNKISLQFNNSQLTLKTLKQSKLRVSDSSSIFVIFECIFDDLKIILIKLTNILNDIIHFNLGNIHYQWLAIFEIIKNMGSC